jgi:hypothetical protein
METQTKKVITADTFIAGTLGYEQIYETIRKPNMYMRIFSGFGISKQLLEMLDKDKVSIIKIIYKEEKREIIYLSALKQWQDSLNVWEYEGRLSEGEKDLQIFLPVKEMIVLKSEEKK